jgi:hypothetical protein
MIWSNTRLFQLINIKYSTMNDNIPGQHYNIYPKEYDVLPSSYHNSDQRKRDFFLHKIITTKAKTMVDLDNRHTTHLKESAIRRWMDNSTTPRELQVSSVLQLQLQ